MAAPWMTTYDSFNRKIKSFEHTVFPESLHAVFGARRIEPAVLAQQWREKELVQADEPCEDFNG
jgi:hypothetical protein